MMLQIFAVRDRATDQFGTPMFLVTAGQAIRSFSDEINRQAADNLLHTHPDDYDLYALGSYDTVTGLFLSGPPEQLAVGKNLKLNGKG